MKLSYVREQSVVDCSGVLDDGGRLSGSALAELLALRVCSCEAAHFRGPHYVCHAYRGSLEKMVPGFFATKKTYQHIPTHHKNMCGAPMGRVVTLFTVDPFSVHTTSNGHAISHSLAP